MRGKLRGRLKIIDECGSLIDDTNFVPLDNIASILNKKYDCRSKKVYQIKL